MLVLIFENEPGGHTDQVKGPRFDEQFWISILLIMFFVHRVNDGHRNAISEYLVAERNGMSAKKLNQKSVEHKRCLGTYSNAKSARKNKDFW